MEKYFGSKAEKVKGRLYFSTNADRDRDGDIIVIWYMKTPTGRFSKFYHVKRWAANAWWPTIAFKAVFSHFYELLHHW